MNEWNYAKNDINKKGVNFSKRVTRWKGSEKLSMPIPVEPRKGQQNDDDEDDEHTFLLQC